MKKRERDNKEQERLETLLFGKFSRSEEENFESEEIDDYEEDVNVNNNDNDYNEPLNEAVWIDDEEDNIEIDLNATARLKKLKNNVSGNNKVKGSQFSKLLKERYACYILFMRKIEYNFVFYIYQNDDNTTIEINKCLL